MPSISEPLLELLDRGGGVGRTLGPCALRWLRATPSPRLPQVFLHSATGLEAWGSQGTAQQGGTPAHDDGVWTAQSLSGGHTCAIAHPCTSPVASFPLHGPAQSTTRAQTNGLSDEVPAPDLAPKGKSPDERLRLVEVPYALAGAPAFAGKAAWNAGQQPCSEVQ